MYTKVKKDIFIIFVLIILSVLFVNCGGGSGSNEDMGSDSSSLGSDTLLGSDTGSLPTSLDTEIMIEDERPEPPPPHPEIKTAFLGYSYPATLKREEVRHVNVLVRINNPNGIIAETLDSINVEQDIYDSPKDIFKTFTENIMVYKFLTITLMDPKDVFDIKPIHNFDRQEINLDEGNRWDWAITTKTSDKKGYLILKVDAEKPNKVITPLKDKNIPIVIEIDNTSVVRKIWIYLIDHPEYILGAILLPVIGYFGKKYLDRQKKDKPKKYY